MRTMVTRCPNPAGRKYSAPNGLAGQFTGPSEAVIAPTPYATNRRSKWRNCAGSRKWSLLSQIDLLVIIHVEVICSCLELAGKLGFRRGE